MLLATIGFCGLGFYRYGQGANERRELKREKMWARIHLTPLLEAEHDRDEYRRTMADRAVEGAIMARHKKWKKLVADEYAFKSVTQSAFSALSPLSVLDSQAHPIHPRSVAMASWRASYNGQLTHHTHRTSLSSTYSQEADGHEHYQQKMAAPSSPVFDLDEFIYDPSTTTSTSTNAELTSGVAATGGMSGLPDAAQLGSATHAHHANGHSWTTSGGDIGGWDSVSNVFQGTPSSSFYGVSFPTSIGTHPKPSLKTTTTPQSILNNYYGSGLASFQHTSTSGFSDHELGLDSSNGADLFPFPTKTDAMAEQQQQHSMFDQGVYPDMNKMMLLSQSEPAYAYTTLNTQAQAQPHHQRRGSIRRDSTPSIPFSTATSFPLNIQPPSFSFTQPSNVFPMSAHTPSSSLSSSSFLSNLSPTSPLGSPHFSDRCLSISPSIPPASPLSTSAVGAMYYHHGPGTSPTPSFGGVPPAQLSASPHQFSSAPITFVNQTSQFTKFTDTRDSSPKEADVDEYLPSTDDRRLGFDNDDGTRQRKRRRTLSNSVMGEESDEKRDEDIPNKSELRPPKQAPSMWQVYFADWLQDHKTRHPHDKLNVAQAAKEAGQLYKTLTEANKEDLKRRVQIEKQSREQRLAAWQRTLTPNDIKRENKFRAAQRKAGLSRRANIKDPNAPKKPLSAYFMFLAKIRSDPRLVEEVFGGETETTRQSVLAAQTWREMSDEEKKPFLTQAEHDKIQYEALRKVYEERAGSGFMGTSHNRKQMAAGTGYIVPQQMSTTLSDDVTASILSANPNTGNRYSSHGGSDSDDLHMVSYDPQATVRKASAAASSRAIAAAAASFVANGKMSSSIPVSFSATGTVRRRAAAARKSARHIMMDDGAQSPPDSSEDDDEWVPGKSI